MTDKRYSSFFKDKVHLLFSFNLAHNKHKESVSFGRCVARARIHYKVSVSAN